MSVKIYLSAWLAIVLSFGAGGCNAYRWPSPQYEALEAFLYEGRRSDGSNMASLQHPCKTRNTGGSIGAEWLRLAFHDSATHDAEAGTGGLDASIAFELHREENIGAGMNVALSDFESFPNKYISRSDVIAAGTVFAVASCGGPIIPYRAGRLDALSSGPMGVPEPQQDLRTHTEMFRRQGFSQSEMITLVACGHTIGAVRSHDFPSIVAQDPESPSKSIVVDFDISDEFDNMVVQHYLDGSTANPLVVNSNQNVTSDLRIFSSDNNATMQGLVDADSFTQSCSRMLERMINLVPSSVTLTEEITLLHTKVSDMQLTLERDGLIFKVNLRLTQTIGTKPSKNRIVRLFWCDRYGAARDCSTYTNVVVPATTGEDDPNVSPITQRLGYYFLNYRFIVKIDPTKSVSTFWFEKDEHDGSDPTPINNDGMGYQLQQDRIIFVPMMGGLDFQTYDNDTKVYHIVAGVRNDVSPSRVYLNGFDSATTLYQTLLNTTLDLSLNSTLPATQGYNFYTVSLEDSGLQLTIDLHAEIDGTIYSVDFQQTSYLGGGIPYTQPTVSNITTVKPPSPTLASSSPGTSSRTLSYVVYFTWTLFTGLSLLY